MRNRRFIVPVLTLFFIIQIIISAHSQEQKKPPEQRSFKTSINWPDIQGAIMYNIEVADVNYKIVFQETVIPSNIEFSLPAGEYRVRIGTVNKFQKIAGWSDWAVLKVTGKVKKKAKEKITFNNSIKIAVGVPYFQILSDYSNFFNNSFYGGTFMAGSRIPTIIPFLNSAIFNYMGLEIEGTYIKFEGKEIPNRVKTNKTDIIAGINLYFATDLDIPVNFILRGGGGIVQTKFEYADSVVNEMNEYNDNVLTSIDFYYKAGASIEYSFIKYFFVEAGADYYDFRYVGVTFTVLRYFLLAGVMF